MQIYTINSFINIHPGTCPCQSFRDDEMSVVHVEYDYCSPGKYEQQVKRDVMIYYINTVQGKMTAWHGGIALVHFVFLYHLYFLSGTQRRLSRPSFLLEWHYHSFPKLQDWSLQSAINKSDILTFIVLYYTLNFCSHPTCLVFLLCFIWFQLYESMSNFH